MVASFKNHDGITRRLGFYVRGQAPSLGDYLLQGFLTSLFGWVPGLPGIAARAVAYRLMLTAKGLPAIESGVRLRHARAGG